MKRLKSFLKKSVFMLVFFAVALYQPLCCYAEEKTYIITENQLLELEQNNLIVQNELKELQKQQEEQSEYSKMLEREKEALQKEIEKEKRHKKMLINTIPVAIMVGAVCGIFVGLASK